MEGPIRPKHHPRPLAVVSRMSADRLWLAHGRLWLTLPKTLQVLTSARLSPAHARLWLSADRPWLAYGRLWRTLPKTLQVLTSARLSRAHARPWLTLSDIVQLLIAQVPSKPAS